METKKNTFSELKNHLYSTHVLTLPDLQEPFDIETNASDYVISVVLTQHGNPVAYHNETLSNTI
ncbi:RNase H-like domain-containing protein [Actinobacillus pleuropneumoniae]|uniref:RNase H-like domain-containing protein n=1 Tax=Actinobacillus pleuropneumoniae TaxID=715 RepID=UPI0034DCF487